MNSLLIAKNLVKRTLRNRKEFIVLILLPIIIIGIMALMISEAGTDNTTIGIIDKDNDIYSQVLIENLKNEKNISLNNITLNNYQQLINQHKVDFVILFPENMTKKLSDGEQISVIFYDKKSSSEEEHVKQVINQTIYNLDVLEYAANELVINSNQNKDDFIKNALVGIYHPFLNSEIQMVGIKSNQQAFNSLSSSIGFAIVFIMLMVFTTMSTIMEDKRRLTLARVFVFPTKDWEIVLGNLLGSLTIGVFQLIPILLTLKFVFHIPWGLSILELFLTLFCFLLQTIGLGIGLSGIVKQNYNPTILMSTVIVPSSILGGAFIPSSMMPSFLDKIGYIVPQKWLMNAIEQILLGANLPSISIDLFMILLFGLAFTTFGLKTIKPLDE